MMKAEEDTEKGTVVRSTMVQAAPRGNSTLERESQGCSSILFYMAIFLMLDVWKQITSYGMKYYNNNRYPLPQTQVVALTECTKFGIFFAVLIYTQQIRTVKLSLWYAVPSVIYAVNNNVYYYALNYVTPPIWNIIIQLRVLFTALTYRIIFKKEVSNVQWGSLTLLIVAIILTNMTGGNKVEGSNNFFIAVCLAVVGSILSVFGTVVMEYLFKNDKRPFAEMQMQLYLFSGTMAWVFYMIEIHSTKEHTVNETANWNLVVIMVAGCIILSCTSGISVAFIVKKLDNIVKLYSQALSNMLTSVACTILFPDHFNLNFMFVMCLLLMFAAIFLYENKNWNSTDALNFVKQHKAKVATVGFIILVASVLLIFYFSTKGTVVNVSSIVGKRRLASVAPRTNSSAAI